MPLGLFEIIYVYHRLMSRDGKAPTMERVADELGMAFRAVHQRQELGERLGVLAKRYKLQWCQLTTLGARKFEAVMDGREAVLLSYRTGISKNPNARPPSGITYQKIKFPEYVKYLKDNTV